MLDQRVGPFASEAGGGVPSSTTRSVDVPRHPADEHERHARGAVVEQRVGARGQLNGFARQRQRLVVTRRARARIAARTPRQGIAVLRSSPPSRSARRRELFGLLRPRRARMRAREQRRGARGVGVQTHRREPVVGAMRRCSAAARRRRRARPCPRTRPSRAARVAGRAPRASARGREHLACGVGPSAERFEHGLTAERRRLDGGRTRRDAQEPDDVEAPSAGPYTGARPPERRTGAAPSTAVIRRRLPASRAAASAAVERCLALADLSEHVRASRAGRVRLRRPRRVAELRSSIRGRRGDASAVSCKPRRIDEVRELPAKHVAHAFRGAACPRERELVDGRAAAYVAGRGALRSGR